MSDTRRLKINQNSIANELASYKGQPYKCLFEYIWNSLDAGATKIEIIFDRPRENFGFARNLKLIDNGRGWDFDELNTDYFLSSTKSEFSTNDKTLPKGRFGRGRYTFIWIAKEIEIFSKKKKMILDQTINLNPLPSSRTVKGTEVHFFEITEELSDRLLNEDSLRENLLLEFGWFLVGNPLLTIMTNGKPVDPGRITKKEIEIKKTDLPNDIKRRLSGKFTAKIVLWSTKPSPCVRIVVVPTEINSNNYWGREKV